MNEHERQEFLAEGAVSDSVRTAEATRRWQLVAMLGLALLGILAFAVIYALATAPQKPVTHAAQVPAPVIIIEGGRYDERQRG